MIIWLKRLFRPLYYLMVERRIVVMKKPAPLEGLRWIVNQRFDRAYFKGYYEPEIVSFLINEVKPGNNFIDVGGHAGYFSFLFARLSPQGKVFTFEPDKSNSGFIKQIIELNGIDNIQLEEKAVGSESGTLFFTNGPTSSTGHVGIKGDVEVTVVKLDEYIRQNKIEKINFMKIDVEGFGGEVLKGASSLIRNFKPVILMELHDHSNERNTLMQLKSFGYDFFDLSSRPSNVENTKNRFYVARISESNS